jgi:hypothetical protein
MGNFEWSIDADAPDARKAQGATISSERLFVQSEAFKTLSISSISRGFTGFQRDEKHR